MTEDECLKQFVIPSMRRPDRWNGGILQIHITRSCDKHCAHCSQASDVGGKNVVMTPDQFETAVKSLATFPYTVGVFGGNPCVSKFFPEICEILKQYIPFERRGLWSNKAFGHGKLCASTYNHRCSNINAHLDKEAWDEWLRDWPALGECIGPNLKGLDEDSRHGPAFVAMKDVGLTQEEIYERAASCEVQRNWSSICGVFRGEVLGYTCELMYAQSAIHENDPDWPKTGINVDQMYDGKYWWELPVSAFADQVRYHCGRCGIPLKGHGQLAIGGTKRQVSETHAKWYGSKVKGVPMELVTSLEQLQPDALPSSILYIENSHLPILN